MSSHALRRNVGPRAIARELVQRCGWLKVDARAVTGKKWRPSHSSPRKALDERAQRVLWRALDAEVDPDVALVLRLCLVLGLRIAEATTVNISRVTRDGRGLRVLGKGSKWRTVPLDVDARARSLVAHLPAETTGDGHGREHVPGGAPFRPSREAGHALRHADPPGAFQAADGREAGIVEAPHRVRPGRPVSPSRAQRACSKLASSHPELADLTPHVLRHTFATNALRRCIDPKKLQAALGHDKFGTTLTYLHTLERA